MLVYVNNRFFIFIQLKWDFGGSARVLEENMSSLSRELVFLILQFLDEEKHKETVHRYFFLGFEI